MTRTGLAFRATVLGVAILAVATQGCTPASQGAPGRRQVEVLARRLTQTRADVERLRGEVDRLKGRLDELSYRDRRYGGGGYDPELEGLGLSGDGAGEGGRDDRLGGFVAANPPPDPENVGTEVLTGVPPATPDPNQPAATEERASSADVQQDLARGGDPDYEQGLKHYQQRDFGRAVQSLRRYVSAHPRGASVPQAQFWLGESYFAQGKFNEAILAYNEILVGWPQSPRVPAALLRQAGAFVRLGDKIDARLILKKLIEEHPTTDEAAAAKDQLRDLGA